MYYVYLLELSNKSYYLGYSNKLKTRISEHNNGKVKTTKNYRPLKLIFYAAFQSKTKALNFERYLKEGSGFAFRNKHLI